MPTYPRLLTYLLVAAFVFGAGARLGYKYADGHNAKAAAEAQEHALEGAREQAEIDKQQAVSRARRETLAAERARTVRERGVSDANLKANPVCNRDDVSFGLLIDAIKAANGTEDGSRGVPEEVPGLGPAKGWFGQGSAAVGVQRNR